MDRFGIECKKQMLVETQEKLKDASAIFFTSFKSMSVSEQEDLRHKLDGINASLFVVKNRIAERAFKQLGQDSLVAFLQGISALTLGGEDSIAVSKILTNFAGKNENFKILGAYIDQEVLNSAAIKTLASIPSKEVLLAQVVGGIKSPIQGLVNSLSITIKKFIVAIDKIRDNKK